LRETQVELAAELLGGPSCQLGEGPVWHAERQELGWVDILGQALHRATIDAEGRLGEVRTITVADHLSAAVPVAEPRGGWLLAVGPGFAYLGPDDTLTELAQPEADRRGANRMNDGKCDPAGRWWIGSMSYTGAPDHGSLYRVDLDGSVTAVLTGVGCSNGLGWSLDGRTMYYNDTTARTLSAFDFDPATGGLGHRRVLADHIAGFLPDGLTTDDAGGIWSASWDEGTIRHYDPAGTLVGRVRVPVQRTSSCCFAGPRRDLLVITTGRIPDQDEPDAGRLFMVRPGVTGPAATPFAGQLPR
jgi:sugar lactone lactonase YvrE